MGVRIFKGSTVDECLEKARQELKVAKENLTYKVIEEKKGFFKKNASIEVDYEEKDATENIVDNKNGWIKIENGTTIVKNPESDGKPAMIQPSKDVKLYINGEEVLKFHEVYEDSKIEVLFDNVEAKRLMNVSVTPDRLQARSSIEYVPEITYGLKNQDVNRALTIELEKKEEKYPPLFTMNEIKLQLAKLGIRFGIIEENIKACCENRTITDLVIAEGISVVDDIDDRIEIKFNATKNPLEFEEDQYGKIDFKNISSIDTVKKGHLLAEKIFGSQGSNGKDVYGNVIRKKEKKSINLKIGGGCEIKDPNTVVASIDGKPCVKNGLICVYQLHEVLNDVDIKNGNINFIGDVKVNGSVREGMKVEAGNGIEIGGDIEKAVIKAKGNINIKGNSITSNISSGGEDVVVLRLVTSLKELKAILKALIEAVMEIKKFNLLGQKATDGEIIKVLIENKFKTIPKYCASIIRDIPFVQDDDYDEVIMLIRQKLVGMAPLAINHFSELELINEAIDMKIEELNVKLSLPVNVSVAYCQDSFITSSGDIFITGKGTYVSQLTAHKGIYFLDERAVCRGGTIKAKTEIKCRKVGSTGGVSTILSVEEGGEIWADVAFHNTSFAIGLKEYVLEKPSKNVHAFIDKNGELIVDKLYL